MSFHGDFYAVVNEVDRRERMREEEYIIIKNWRTGDLIQILRGFPNRVSSVAWSPDGSMLASAGDNVKLWSAETWELLQTLEGYAGVYSVAWSPDGSMLASGSVDSTVKVWSVETGECTQTLEGHSDWVLSVAWSPDGSMLASGAYDKTVKVWSDGRCIKTLRGHTSSVNSVAWAPDGRIASGSSDKTVKVWSVETEPSLPPLPVNPARQSTAEQSPHIDPSLRTLNHPDWVRSVMWSPDGSKIMSGSDNNVKVWSSKLQANFNITSRSLSNGLIGVGIGVILIPTFDEIEFLSKLGVKPDDIMGEFDRFGGRGLPDLDTLSLVRNIGGKKLDHYPRNTFGEIAEGSRLDKQILSFLGYDDELLRRIQNRSAGESKSEPSAEAEPPTKRARRLRLRF